ncbi:hypothetical protein FGO68_gene14345 [Halteria grandinella]|uniref:Cadherin domain-containing protein n=1 Tax=Halteria grandinella TaxID=5974 RepID=A0A8J8T9H5_HALGN|nr:hypothetical protein FGO68_gene14345 [Halteria grandinella]
MPIKVITFLLMLLQQSHQSCSTTQASFPKMVGGNQAQTGFRQIDYNQVTDYLVAGGHSYDQGVRGDTLGIGPFFPIIIAYESNGYKWGKVFTSMVNNHFYGVKINRLGTRVVAVNRQTIRFLIVMDITNGNVFTATSFTVTVDYEFNRRNLLLLDDGTILMGDDSQIIKVAPPSTSASTYTLAGYSTIGLQTNTVQSYLHVFAYASSICMITVMDMATFTRVYQFQAQCASTAVLDLASTLQSCIFETSSTVDSIIFQEGTRFFRVKSQYSTSTYITSTVHDPAAPSLKGRGLYCVSNNLVYSLMLGTYSTDINRIIVAEVNFNTNQITYTRYLQDPIGNVYHGVIYSAKQFYLAGQSQLIYKSTSTSFNTRAPQQSHGIIYSPMHTCQLVYSYTYPIVSLTVNGFTFTATTNTYLSSTLTVPDLTSSLPPTSHIVTTEFEGQYVADCSLSLPQAPHAYTALSSTQATNAFIYAIESTSLTISITPFTATKLSSADPVFTYQLDTYYQPPNSITVNAATGDIVISSVSALGASTQSVVIEGKLQECQTITATVTLTGQANTPPSFFAIVGSILPDLRVEQGQLTIYTLPIVVDPNAGQTTSIILIDGGNSAYPMFVDFTDTSHKAIIIEPNVSTTFGTYLVSVQLNDGIVTTTYSLNIVVTGPSIPPIQYQITNQGPPIFISPIETMELIIGNVMTFELPSMIDPDDDKISVTVNLKESTLFCSYDEKLKKFTFKPSNGAIYSDLYRITIKLVDNNINPKKSVYSLDIKFQQSQKNESQNISVICGRNSTWPEVQQYNQDNIRQQKWKFATQSEIIS